MNKPLRSSAIHGLAVAAVLGGLGLAAHDRLVAQRSSTSASTLVARLSGASEVPPTDANGSGTLQATLDKNTRVLTWTVTLTGLSGPPTAAHFHGPAAAGENAGVAVPLVVGLKSPDTGTATLTSAQMEDLLAGKWYVNVHTSANPNGEIRGQVMIGQ